MPLFILFYILIFFLGAAIFSFLNVIVYRLPRQLNYISGHSMCPICEKKLFWFHNIPIFSYIFLRGKCAFCGAKISFRYFIFELLGGSISLLTFIYYVRNFIFDYHSLLEWLTAFALMCALVVVFFIDKDTMEIPNGLPIFIAFLGIISYFVFSDISLADRIIGALCVSVPFFLLTLAIDGAFGGGDIKLMAAVGLFLGWKLTLVSVFIGIIVGGGYAAYLLIAKKKERKDHFAFGPFLCVGIAIAWFFGTPLLHFYLNFFS